MPPVIAFVDDLMFLSRIRETARETSIEVASARSVPDLLEACRRGAALVIVDLDSRRMPALDALAALRADPSLGALPVVGFFSHVHAERAREAREAGCTQALPRSVFVARLPEILSEGLGEARTGA